MTSMKFFSDEENNNNSNNRTNSKNLERILNPLFKYLQEEYTATQEEAVESGFIACSFREKLDSIEDTVYEINKLYCTKYQLRKS